MNRSRRWTMSASASRRGRRWGWLARAVAARPHWAAPSCGSVEPTSGSILLNGEDITQMGGANLRARRRKFQMIFQDPYGSLNPRMTVEQIVGEALDIHKLTDTKSARRKRIAELLQAVGLDPIYAQRYPHVNSAVASASASASPRALAVEPQLQSSAMNPSSAAGCLRAGADHQPAPRPPATARHRLHLLYCA